MSKIIKRTLMVLMALMLAIPVLPIIEAQAVSDGVAIEDGAVSENGNARTKAKGNVTINKKNFPDKKFREYVKKAFDKNNNGVLSKAERNAVKKMSIYGNKRNSRLEWGISNFKGLEHFPNLQVFEYTWWRIKKIDFSKNKKLRVIDVRGTSLKKLDVRKNTELRELVCIYNELKKLDVRKNKKLVKLLAGYNPLTTLDLSKNTKLKELNCEMNNFRKLVGVKKLTKLKANKTNLLGNFLSEKELKAKLPKQLLKNKKWLKEQIDHQRVK